MRIKNLDKHRIAASQKMKEKKYWLEKMSGDFVKSEFPFDYKRIQRKEGLTGNDLYHQLTFSLSQNIYNGLIKVSQNSDNVLHMILIAGLTALVYKYTDTNDIILGTPIYKQDTQSDFLNTMVPLRTNLSESMSFKELLVMVRQTVMEAHEHRNYPIEILSEQLELPVTEDEFPLFDIVLLLENLQDKSYIGDIQPNIIFSFLKVDGRLDGTIYYNTLRYRKGTIQQIQQHFQTLLRNVMEQLDLEIRHLDILRQEEKKQLLNLFNEFSISYKKDRTIDALFSEQVRQTPDRIAIVGTGFKEFSNFITYRELDRKANQLAHLLKEKGVGPDIIVGIILERSIQMMVAILGILKAGGAYLPIDPEMPANRIIPMLDDCDVKTILTEKDIVDRFSFTSLQNLKDTLTDSFMVLTERRPQITDFDSLPAPNRGLVDYHKYHKFIGVAPVKHSISIQATRGCPYNCLYCHKIWPKTHVIRTAENIFQELLNCYKTGVKRFCFVDDIINLNIKNSTRLFKLIIENNMDIQMMFPNGVRGDILTEEFIDLMMEAGTVDIMMALETASPRLQKKIGKNLNLERFEKNLQYIIKNYPHINLEMNIMIGFPGETEEEAMESLNFLFRQKWIHFPNMNVLKIYPNTDMYRMAIENGVSEEAITRSRDLAYHELPDTLTFSKSFARKFQSRFLEEYFLNKERLLYVLPYQMKIFTEDELIQKYDSYLPAQINSFDHLLEFLKITREELGHIDFLAEERVAAPDFDRVYRKNFPVPPKAKDAYRILFIDLSLFFTNKKENLLYNVAEAPLGFMSLISYLDNKFGDKIAGKIIKSNIDFDNYQELKEIIHNFKPDLIGIRTLSYYKDFFHATVTRIKQWGVEAPIIAGGPYASSDYFSMLQDKNVSLAVIGEGEITLAQLMEKIFENDRKLPGEDVLREIKGLAFVKVSYKKRLQQINRTLIHLDDFEREFHHLPSHTPETIHNADNLCYVIFTSGSTGKPKGTLISHQNVIRIAKDTNYIDITSDDRILQLSNYSFDGSVFDIYGALLNGGALVLINKEEVFEVDKLAKRIQNENITIFFVTTALFNLIVDLKLDALGAVRKILFGGERVTVEYVEAALKHLGEGKIIHMYGPTETTVYSTAHEVRKIDPKLGTIPIGKPILESPIYILNKHLSLVPIGVAGEIYIGGASVSRGYLNRPELTSEKFIANPFDNTNTNQRVYRTGDLAKWLDDGTIEFLGRVDHQIKIRGFRIELGEIEKRIMEHQELNDVVVIASEENESGFQDRFLCAYFVSDSKMDISDLRTYLSYDLPVYMIPAYFIQLDKIPLTSNGKVDRKALPDPVTRDDDTEFTSPRNEIETILAEIWSEVLGIQKNKISIHDDFFQVGGQSLKVMVLMTRIHEKLDVTLPIAEIFKTPTIRDLAQYIKNSVTATFESIEKAAIKEYYKVSSAQKRLYLLQQISKSSVVYNIPFIRELTGPLEIDKFTRCFQRLIERHESLRTYFEIIEGEIVQKIISVDDYIDTPEEIFHLEFYECQGREELESTGLVRTFIRSFDLSKAPLMRVRIVKIDSQTHILMVDMHHIITDGVSMGIVIEEFIKLYQGVELPELNIQYKDYSEWQHTDARARILQEQEQYWLKVYEKEPPLLNLPLDYSRPETISFKGNHIGFSLENGILEKLHQFKDQEGVTLFILLLAIFNVFLSKLSDQEDIVVGTVTAGRNHADLQNIIGMFVNTLALRNRPNRKMSFNTFLKTVKKTTLEAFQKQDYQFDELIEKANFKRSANRNPLFDVAFVLQNLELKKIEIPGLVMKYYEQDDFVAKYDLTLSATENGDDVVFSFEYSTSLFKKETIETFVDWFKTVTVELLENPDIMIEKVEMISHDEKQRLIGEIDENDDDLEIDFDY